MIPLKDDNPSHRPPVVNCLLIGANIAVFLYQFMFMATGPGYLISTLGFIPYELSHYTDITPHNLLPVPLTVISSMFLHGGWLHLLGNMLFLWVFGDNVEDRLGHVRYLLFYLACGVAAALVHGAVFPDSRVPTVGASGAISGVLAAYMICFPKARVTTLFVIVFFIRIVRIPAFVLLGLWIVLQILSGVNELSASTGGIAWFAHIGGFAAGVLFLFMLKPKKRHIWGRP